MVRMPRAYSLVVRGKIRVPDLDPLYSNRLPGLRGRDIRVPHSRALSQATDHRLSTAAATLCSDWMVLGTEFSSL